MPSVRLLRPRASSWIAGGGLVATLAAGVLVPIYTDEVGWRAQLARSPFDGGVDRELADQCGPNTNLAAPWFMQPMRHATAWIEAWVADPRAIRLLGVATAMLLLVVLGGIARSADRARWPVSSALTFALLGLGTMPFLLVWSRPEQPILLALATAVLLALTAPPGACAASMRAAAILLLAIFALGAHPKAVVFAPILIVAALLAGRGRDALAVRIGVAVAITLLAGEAFGYWNMRFACPNDPVIAAHNAAENLSAAGEGWVGLVRALACNILPTDYVVEINPAVAQMSDWLPPIQRPRIAVAAWFLPIRIAWLFAFLAIVVGLAFAAADAWRRRMLDPRSALAATIVLCVLGWSALQTNKNSYEAALVLPLCVLALVLVLPALAARWPRLIARTAIGAVALALVSEVLLLVTYVPALARTAAKPGTIADQPYSFTPWGYPAMRADILAAGGLCGIDPARARYLLVDDLTYWTYFRSWRPMNRMAVLDGWIAQSRDPLGFLRAHGSSGIVTQCAVLPPALRARAKALGQFCCVGPL